MRAPALAHQIHRAQGVRLVLVQPVKEGEPVVEYKEVTIDRPPNRRLNLRDVVGGVALLVGLMMMLGIWLTILGNSTKSQNRSYQSRAVVCQVIINLRTPLPVPCQDPNVLRYTTPAGP